MTDTVLNKESCSIAEWRDSQEEQWSKLGLPDDFFTRSVTEEARVMDSDILPDETKPVSCPFCGTSKGLMVVRLIKTPGWFCVDCSRCEALGPLGSTREVAVRLWNDRK